MVYNDYGEGYRGGLNDRCVTLGEVLGAAGYGTYMSGKWHITRFERSGPEGPKDNWPRQRGFDRFFGTLYGAGSHWTPLSLTRDNTRIDNDFPEGFYYSDAIAENASGYIREHRKHQPDKPFFWVLHGI